MEDNSFWFAQDPLTLIPEEIMRSLFSSKPKIQRIAGLTNRNYLIFEDSEYTDHQSKPADKTHQTKKYVLKLLNPFLKNFIDRDNELLLTGVPLPKVIYRTHGVRIDEFVEGDKVDPPKISTNNYAVECAKILLRIHQMPITKDGFGKKSTSPKLKEFIRNSSEVKQIIEQRLDGNPHKDLFLGAITTLEKDKGFLLALLEGLERYTCICHNDFNLPNLFELKKAEDKARFGGPLLLIDYEYCGVNFIFFELGNLLHELECQYPEEAPYFKLNDEFHPPKYEADPEILRHYYNHSPHIDKSKLAFKEFKRLCEEFKIFSIYWWLWLGIHEAPEGWEGLPHYVKLKLESYQGWKEAIQNPKLK